MAETSLETTSGSGSQTATQSPQSATTTTGTGTAANGLQPGINQDALRSGSGVPIINTQPNSISLNSVSASTAVPVAAPQHHHANPVLAGFSIGLFALAVLLFWLTSRSVKTTT